MYVSVVPRKTADKVRRGYCLTILAVFIAALGALDVATVSPAHAQSGYKLSILSIYSSAETNAQIRPLAKHLSAALKAPVEPVIYSDNAQYEKALASRICEAQYARSCRNGAPRRRRRHVWGSHRDPQRQPDQNHSGPQNQKDRHCQPHLRGWVFVPEAHVA